MPEDGLPSIDDWITTFNSILLDGLDLGREPLDVSVGNPNLSNLQFALVLCELSVVVTVAGFVSQQLSLPG